MKITNITLKRGWIYLALATLIVPGLAAILLVLLRSLELDASQWQSVFLRALVIHVDLSIYAFMMVIGILMVSMQIKFNLAFEKILLLLCWLGSGLIAVSPFIGSPTVIISNYIPVLESSIFFVGLIIFSVTTCVFFTVATFKKDLSLGLKISSGLYVIAVLMVLHSVFILANNPQSFYELVFWGGGHVLQLVITLLMMLAWVVLIKKAYSLKLNSIYINLLYWLMLASGSYALFIHLNNLPSSPEYRLGMTRMMEWANGVAPMLLAVYILWKIKSANLIKDKFLFALMFYTSLLMFVSGGIVALLISGSNTIIPAHYHGSIVGVTIALMGIIYYYLPKLGYARVQGKLALSQPIIYTIGQLMHIIGLVLIGWAGAARKAVDSSPVADSTLGVVLVRFGGLAAVIGGVLFIVVVIRAIRQNKLI